MPLSHLEPAGTVERSRDPEFVALLKQGTCDSNRYPRLNGIERSRGEINAGQLQGRSAEGRPQVAAIVVVQVGSRRWQSVAHGGAEQTISNGGVTLACAIRKGATIAHDKHSAAAGKNSVVFECSKRFS